MATTKYYEKGILSKILPTSVLVAGFFLIILSLSYNYLLFHTTIEVVSIIIAGAIFLFSLHTRKISKNRFILFLGISYFFVGVFTFLHALSYEGMSIFYGHGSNLATQLWITSRYLLAVSFLSALFFINKTFNEYLVFLIYLVVSTFLLISIFFLNIFPTAYIDGVGLTPFKIESEYTVIFLFIISAVVLYLMRSRFDKKIFYLLLYSTYLTIIGELFFTLYIEVSGLFNVLGHLADLGAYYLIYKAVVETGLSKPYKLLFLELTRLDKRKTDFLNIAGHEIKNPLTAIELSTGLLSNQLTNSNHQTNIDDINQIKKEAEKINLLVNDLLDISKLESNNMSFTKEEFDINDFLIETVARSKKIYDKNKFGLQLLKDNVKIKADKKRIDQVLSNIIGNAVKYSKTGSKILISAKITRISPRKKRLTVAIRDFGIGIEASQKKQIFDKYYRTGDGKTFNEGTGLGLYISKQIITAHKGRIWVKSNKDKGSTFYIALPA